MNPSYLNYHRAKWENAVDHSRSLTAVGSDEISGISETRFDPPIPPPQRFGGATDRDQLTRLGVGPVHATLAIPYLYYVPRTSDADAQGIQVIVGAIQRALGVPHTGYMGEDTARAIAAVSGPTWFDKRWNEILGDVLTRGGRRSLGGLVMTGDAPASWWSSQSTTTKLLIAGAGAAAAYHLLKRKR